MPDAKRMRRLREQYAAAPDLVAELQELRRQLYDTRALLAYLVSDRLGGKVFISPAVSESIDPESAELTWWVDDKGQRCVTANVEMKTKTDRD